MHGNSAPASWAAALGARRRLEQDPHARYTLRRGNLIFKDVTEDGSDKDESDGEEADGEDGKQERERVRTERRELHPAVGSERCASQSPMVSLSPQSLRHSMTAWLTALSTEDVRLADGQDHRDGHERHASPRQEVQLPHCVGRRQQKGPAKLQVDNYGHGSHARYNSWVILTPATGD